jgi:hypothetical protein
MAAKSNKNITDSQMGQSTPKKYLNKHLWVGKK